MRGHEGGALMNGISALVSEAPGSFSLIPSREHTMREEPLLKHAGAWISDVQPPEQ